MDHLCFYELGDFCSVINFIYSETLNRSGSFNDFSGTILCLRAKSGMSGLEIRAGRQAGRAVKCRNDSVREIDSIQADCPQFCVPLN